MARPKPLSWDEIHRLIERADEVRRESEYLRAQAERARHRPDIWPERREPARTHGNENGNGGHSERRCPHEGGKRTL